MSATLTFDLHVHALGVAGKPGGLHLCPAENRGLMLRHLVRRMARLEHIAGGLRAQMETWMHQSRLDRFVLLALDRAHRDDGAPDPVHTRLAVDNDAVADWAQTQPKALFGASVHPWRTDALAELERLARRGACLVKWLPSAQNIAPDDPRCLPFFERMAELRLPLLTHTGVEHTLSAFDDDLNAPRRLRPALERGVTVIAAHCGARMLLHERSYFEGWRRLALDFPNCYGDISGFGLPVHGRMRSALLRDPELATKILFGSDFPMHVFPLWFAGVLGWRQALRLRALANPFDQAAQLMQALGLPDALFTRAQNLLRLPGDAK
ncbi:MAG: amidohydrolase family protein [Kiritimatiellaeota bacterium]|nr:amidohydrolase family protein [Kiritimatiellota bacterium]